MEQLKERYFIVMYAFLAVQRFLIWDISTYRCGHITLSTNDGKYINLEKLIPLIKKDLKNAQAIVITNIIELNQQDYQSWTQTNQN